MPFLVPQVAMAPSFAQVVREQLHEVKLKVELVEMKHEKKWAEKYRDDAIVMEGFIVK